MSGLSGPPGPVPDELGRPRHCDELDRSCHRPLTVVSGPAGYGKTTLVAQWARRAGSPTVGWWTPASQMSVAEALELHSCDGVVVADLGNMAAPDAVLVALVEDLMSRPGDRAPLVLLSRFGAIEAMAGGLLRDLALHLDQRFLALRSDESAELLERLCRSRLSQQAQDEILQIAGGWAAAVTILARSVPPGLELASPVDLDGGRSLVRSYLAAEVLAQLSAEELDLLWLAACTGGLSPALAGHLAGPAAPDMLARLRWQGTFLEPGGQTAWLRLHPALADAVSARHGSHPRRDEVLNEAASWLSDQGMLFEAAHCLLQAEDWDGVEELVRKHLSQILERDQMAQLRELLAALPPQVVTKRQDWALGIAALELMSGRIAAMHELLGVVEPNLDTKGQMVAAGLRCSPVPYLADPVPCLDAGLRAVELCDELGEDYQFTDFYSRSRTDHYRARARSSLLMAGAYSAQWARVGSQYRPVASDTLLEMPAFGRQSLLARRASFLALAGASAEAEVVARQALLAKDESDQLAVADPGQAELALAEALMGCGRLEAAGELIGGLLEVDFGRRTNSWAWLASLRARVALRRGAPREALEVLAAHRGPAAPSIAGRLAAAEALALAATGDHSGAVRALEAAPLTCEVAGARILVRLGSGSPGEAAELIDAWPRDQVPASMVRLHLAEAACAQREGLSRDAQTAFAAALGVAGPHLLAEPFIEMDALGLRLLRRATTTCQDPGERAVAEAALEVVDVGSRLEGDALTPQESLILSHLGREVTLSELAAELHLSVNTVKSHVRAIYRKLGVSTRRQAVDAWREQAGAGKG